MNIVSLERALKKLRPWNSNGTPDRCGPRGNADVPCWAQSELLVYKQAPNPKCLCDSE